MSTKPPLQNELLLIFQKNNENTIHKGSYVNIPLLWIEFTLFFQNNNVNSIHKNICVDKPPPLFWIQFILLLLVKIYIINKSARLQKCFWLFNLELCYELHYSIICCIFWLFNLKQFKCVQCFYIWMQTALLLEQVEK